MGSTIPTPAFPVCMSAALSVRLGNRWSICYDAQKYAKSILDRVTKDRWVYYLKECLKADERILLKMLDDKPLDRWLEVVAEYGLSGLNEDIHEPLIKRLVTSKESQRPRITASARQLVEKLGYGG